MSYYRDREDVFSKVDHEGGIHEVQDYGLDVSDLPQHDTELVEAWTAMAAAWAVYRPLARKVYDLLEEDGPPPPEETP